MSSNKPSIPRLENSPRLYTIASGSNHIWIDKCARQNSIQFSHSCYMRRSISIARHSRNFYPIRGRRNIGSASLHCYCHNIMSFAKICTQWMWFHIVCHPSLTTFLVVGTREFRDYGRDFPDESFTSSVWCSNIISLISCTWLACGLWTVTFFLCIRMWNYFWRIVQMTSWKLCIFRSCLFSAVDMLLRPSMGVSSSMRITTRHWSRCPIKEIQMLLIHVPWSSDDQLQCGCFQHALPYMQRARYDD